jgi:hypothetical protein
VGHREERDTVELDPLETRIGIEDDVEQQMATLMCNQPDHGSRKEPTDRSSLIHTLSWV